MCILNEIRSFVINGKRTLNEAASGRYNVQNESVIEIRHEIFDSVSGLRDDMKALHQDRRNVNADIRTAFEKVVTRHG